MNKMYRLETGSSFCLAPMDHELKDFVKQKKEIKEKLHDHWKIELNVKFGCTYATRVVFALARNSFSCFILKYPYPITSSHKIIFMITAETKYPLFFEKFTNAFARDKLVKKIKNEIILKPKRFDIWLTYVSECIRLPKVQLKNLGAIISNKTIHIARAANGKFLFGFFVVTHILKIIGEKINGKYREVNMQITTNKGYAVYGFNELK